MLSYGLLLSTGNGRTSAPVFQNKIAALDVT
jgi:hypothetical protein